MHKARIRTHCEKKCTDFHRKTGGTHSNYLATKRLHDPP